MATRTYQGNILRIKGPFNSDDEYRWTVVIQDRRMFTTISARVRDENLAMLIIKDGEARRNNKQLAITTKLVNNVTTICNIQP